MATKLSDQEVLNALRTVMDPDLQQDLVTLGMIRDLQVTAQGVVSLKVMLTTPACPLKAKIESDVKQAVLSVEGVNEVLVTMDAEVKKSNQSEHKNTIPGVSNIIAVSSGKGGVGKSTVAVNLAFSLAKQGAKVGLIDADIHGPNIPTMVGAEGPPQIIEKEGLGEFFIPPVAQGVKVMSMGFLVNPEQPMIWRGPMLHNALMQFCHKVEWGQLDYLVIDMPPGTGDVQLSIAQLVPITGAVMVSTPQEVSVQDVKKAFTMWDKVRVPVIGVVENMSYFKCTSCDVKHSLFGDGGGVLLAKKYGVHLLAKLPLVQQVREGGDRGLPVVLRYPDSEIAKEFEALSQSVAQQVSIKSRQAGHLSQNVEIGAF